MEGLNIRPEQNFRNQDHWWGFRSVETFEGKMELWVTLFLNPKAKLKTNHYLLFLIKFFMNEQKI